MNNWDYFGTGPLQRAFDKLSKSFVIELLDKENRLKYPKNFNDL
jgi:hypothetical protein